VEEAQDLGGPAPKKRRGGKDVTSRKGGQEIGERGGGGAGKGIREKKILVLVKCGGGGGGGGGGTGGQIALQAKVTSESRRARRLQSSDVCLVTFAKPRKV